MYRYKYAILVLIMGIIHVVPAHTTDLCATVNQQLTSALKKNYASLISKSLNGKVNPSKVEVDSIMQSGTWTIVYASTPIADPGYFFFDSSTGKNLFKDVWGGIAEKGEAAEIEKWALNLGANKAISSCFAYTVAIAD